MHVAEDASLAQWKDYYRRVYPAKWRLKVGAERFGHYQQAILDLLDPQPGERILECGVRTGEHYGVRVAASGAKLWGVDLAEGLLLDAARAFATRGIRGQLVC